MTRHRPYNLVLSNGHTMRRHFSVTRDLTKTIITVRDKTAGFFLCRDKTSLTFSGVGGVGGGALRPRLLLLHGDGDAGEARNQGLLLLLLLLLLGDGDGGDGGLR